jgi:1-phosphofructokinase family hexose kinase
MASPNLAIDYTVEVSRLDLGAVHRVVRSRRRVGGKGVNVARVVRTFGEPVTLLGFAGGLTGAEIVRGLTSEGIPTAVVRVVAESRTCTIVLDASRSDQTVLNEPGPNISEDELTRFASRYARLLRRADVVVFSGSLPGGLASSTYARLQGQATRASKLVILDFAGSALNEALARRPTLVNINVAEAASALGRNFSGRAGALQAAHMLVERGAESAIVTSGAAGAALANGNETIWASAPVVQAVNSVGSGDAATAASAVCLLRRDDPQSVLRLAVATGTSNTLRGFGYCELEDILATYEKVECRRE